MVTFSLLFANPGKPPVREHESEPIEPIELSCCKKARYISPFPVLGV